MAGRKRNQRGSAAINQIRARHQPGMLPVTDWFDSRNIAIHDDVRHAKSIPAYVLAQSRGRSDLVGLKSWAKSTYDSAADAVVDVVDGASDAIGDAVKDVADTMEDVGDTMVDGVTHVAVTSYELASTLAEDSIDLTKWVGALGVEMAGQGAVLVGPAISMTAKVADTATLGVADELLNVVDNTVLDTVDTLSGGIIDIDYDDGGISANVGIGGVAGFGASIGEDGVSAESTTPLSESSLRVGNNGLEFDSKAGIDQFPLPYVESHIEVDGDGNVSSNQVVQGPYPAYGGVAYGKATVGFERSEEGWAVAGEAEGTWYGLDGTQISGSVGLAYAETEDGSTFAASASGSYSSQYGTASGGVSYDRIEKDGDVLETFEAEASAKGFGLEASAEASYVGIETDEGSVSVWDTDVELEGLGLNELTALGAKAVSATEDPPGVDDDLFGVDPLIDPVVDGLGSIDGAATIGDLDEFGLDSEAMIEVGLGDGTEVVDDQPDVLVDQPEVLMDVSGSSLLDDGIEAADSLENSLDDLFEGLD